MRATTLGRVHAEALAVLSVIDPTGLARTIYADQRGFPTQASGFAPPNNGNGASSPVEAHADQYDPAAVALKRLEALVQTLSNTAAELGHMQAHWCAPARRAECNHCGDATGDHRRKVCRWCASFLSDVGRLPNPQELATRAMGRNVRRPKRVNA